MSEIILVRQSTVVVNEREDYAKVLAFMHPDIRAKVEPEIDHTEEVKIRFGRPLKVKHHGRWHKYPELVITQDHLTDVNANVLGWRDDNRKGIDGTGHRLVRIPSADGRGTDGVNIRIARFITGIAEFLRPSLEESPSILIAGKAGTGKTTLLRDICRILGELWDANLVIVDSSNEVSGDGRVPHPAIGEADRLQVPMKAAQENVIYEAFRNNSGHVIALDEVTTEAEARTLRQAQFHSVEVVATTHGDDPLEVVGNLSLQALMRPKPVFTWLLVTVERGVYNLYKLADAVKAYDEGRPVLPYRSFDLR